jgi:hypothetical protein
LDQNQGAVLAVIHYGTSRDDIEVVGSIKGASQLKRIEMKVLPRKKKILETFAYLNPFLVVTPLIYMDIIHGNGPVKTATLVLTGGLMLT